MGMDHVCKSHIPHKDVEYDVRKIPGADAGAR